MLTVLIKYTRVLLITAYRVLMISHAALGSKVRQSNHHWTDKGLLLAANSLLNIGQSFRKQKCV